mgnify:FL=1
MSNFAVPDPLAGGAIFSLGNDFSKLRSPMPKPTMPGLRPSPAAAAASTPSPAAPVSDPLKDNAAFAALAAASPMPKVTMQNLPQRPIMPPGPW